MLCETCKLENNFAADRNIPEPDWKIFIKRTANLITDEQISNHLIVVREHLYELLVCGIPPELILKELLTELILKCDKEIIPQVVHDAAVYEHKMTQGSKHIVHLETFVAKFMCLYHTNLKSLMEGF